MSSKRRHKPPHTLEAGSFAVTVHTTDRDQVAAQSIKLDASQSQFSSRGLKLPGKLSLCWKAKGLVSDVTERRAGRKAHIAFSSDLCSGPPTERVPRTLRVLLSQSIISSQTFPEVYLPGDLNLVRLTIKAHHDKFT